QMSDDLLTLTANAGSVSADDMELVGWTRAQIETHGKDAMRDAYAAAAARREAACANAEPPAAPASASQSSAADVDALLGAIGVMLRPDCFNVVTGGVKLGAKAESCYVHHSTMPVAIVAYTLASPSFAR